MTMFRILTVCSFLLLPWIACGQAPESSTRDALILKFAGPAIANLLYVDVATPPRKDSSAPAATPQLQNMMWSREAKFSKEKPEVLDMKNVTVMSPASDPNADSGDASMIDDLKFSEMGLMSMKLPKLPQPQILKSAGTVCEQWGGANPQTGKATGLLKCQKSVTWSWAVILHEPDEVRVCFAERLSVTKEPGGTLQASGKVISFGKNGFAITDTFALTLPAGVVWADFDEKGRIQALEQLKQAEALEKISKAKSQ